MINFNIPLTVVEKNSKVLTTPEIHYFHPPSLRRAIAELDGIVIERLVGDVIQSVKIAENPREVEARINPASTDDFVAIPAQINNSVTPAGTTQGAATAITVFYNKTSGGSAGVNDGVVLPAATLNKVIVIVNNCGFAINVYPASGEKHSDLAVNIAKAQADKVTAHYVGTAAGVWTLATDTTS